MDDVMTVADLKISEAERNRVHVEALRRERLGYTQALHNAELTKDSAQIAVLTESIGLVDEQIRLYGGEVETAAAPPKAERASGKA